MIKPKLAAASAVLMLATMSCCTLSFTTSTPPTVVRLFGLKGGGGSGVVIADGWILTASHVLPIVKANSYPCGKPILHPLLDLALIPCKGIEGSGLRISPRPLPLFAPVNAYGWWLGVQLMRTDGYQAGPGEMSAPVIHGCSGGAVVNACGELVGIIATVTYAATTWHIGKDGQVHRHGYAMVHMAGYTPIDSDVLKWISRTLHK